MTVTAVRKDPQNLTMTLTAEFDATPERVWQLWADPRQLERWWGPPTYPSTFTTHDLVPGGRVAYHMTGPEGDQPRGYWNVVEVEPPHRLVFRDGFANDDGTPNPDLPEMEGRVSIEAIGDRRTRMSITSVFADRRGDGAGAGHGRRGGPHPGGRPDRRHPRGGRRRRALTRSRPRQRSTTMIEPATRAIEPTTHTLEVPTAVLTYDIRRPDASDRPGAADDRLAHGCGRLRHPGPLVHGPDGRHLRSARSGAEPAH